MVDILIKIKEFANLCGCSVHTLRYYDSINLLKPVKVDKKSGYRFYRKSQVDKYIKIQRFKEIGFELHTLRYYDSINLLKPVKVDKKSGYRFYRKSQVDKYIKIQRFKEIGFELDEIKSLDNMTNEEIVDFIIVKIENYKYKLDIILDKANDLIREYEIE